MSEIKGLFEKVKIENLMAFLVYGTDSEGESIDDYEEKLEVLMIAFCQGWNGNIRGSTEMTMN